jgi:predicted O-linked N-acetylglucosamine transferase (SPINDLY family)
MLDPPGKSASEVLPAYRRVDIMLDSFPYHGTTTTCEAMLMGVPIVTLVGNACAQRVGLSLVSNLGHSEWAAQTPEQYIEIASRLAGDVPSLAAMRQGLREKFLRSPMCDAAGFSRRFESALREMWRTAAAEPRT